MLTLIPQQREHHSTAPPQAIDKTRLYISLFNNYGGWQEMHIHEYKTHESAHSAVNILSAYSRTGGFLGL